MKISNLKILVFLLTVLVIVTPQSMAGLSTTYYFANLTNNTSLSSVITANQQFYVNVIEDGDDVTFHFVNEAGGISSNITEIYFDDGMLYELTSVVNGPGVDFDDTYPLHPGNLPSGENLDPDFVATTGLSVDSDSPGDGELTGINPGEWVSLTYSLETGKVYSDVINAINEGLLGNDTLRIGIHVRSIGPNEDSDSFTLVPLPATLLLGLLGLGVGGWKLRKLV